MADHDTNIKLLEGETPRAGHRPGASEMQISPYGAPATNPRAGRYRIDKQEPEALVIHCGDPRFQTAFRSFVTNELGVRNYTPVIVGGGIHAFGMQSFLPKNFKILWEQIKFFLKEGSIRQVIVINHEDCTWYDKMKGYHPAIQLPLKGKLDLKTAATLILRDFAGVQVRMFWAALEGEEIQFSEVTED